MKTTKTRTTVTETETTSIGKKILVNVVLDRSGSMEGIRDSTISGYNEYLRGLLNDSATEYNVSLIQFDAPLADAELTISYIDKPLADVPTLSRESYVPRGNTPLYDAIGETIRRTELIQKGRPVLTLIITDGLENASREFNRETIKAYIKNKEEAGWTFVFLGANIDSYKVGGAMGASVGNTSNYNAQNIRGMFTNSASATLDYASERRSTGTMGQSVGEAFFTNEQRKSNMAPPEPEPPAAAPKKRDWKESTK